MSLKDGENKPITAQAGHSFLPSLPAIYPAEYVPRREMGLALLYLNSVLEVLRQ